MQQIIRTPAMQAWLTENGVPPQPGPPEAFATEMHPVADSLGRLLREANIRLE